MEHFTDGAQRSELMHKNDKRLEIVNNSMNIVTF